MTHPYQATRTFACMAEAVAYYHRFGFCTTDSTVDGCRVMENGCNEEVYIRRTGFMDYRADCLDMFGLDEEIDLSIALDEIEYHYHR